MATTIRSRWPHIVHAFAVPGAVFLAAIAIAGMTVGYASAGGLVLVLTGCCALTVGMFPACRVAALGARAFRWPLTRSTSRQEPWRDTARRDLRFFWRVAELTLAFVIGAAMLTLIEVFVASGGRSTVSVLAAIVVFNMLITAALLSRLAPACVMSACGQDESWRFIWIASHSCRRYLLAANVVTLAATAAAVVLVAVSAGGSACPSTACGARGVAIGTVVLAAAIAWSYEIGSIFGRMRFPRPLMEV
jgi:hypothetical protein